MYDAPRYARRAARLPFLEQFMRDDCFALPADSTMDQFGRCTTCKAEWLQPAEKSITPVDTGTQASSSAVASDRCSSWKHHASAATRRCRLAAGYLLGCATAVACQPEPSCVPVCVH